MTNICRNCGKLFFDKPSHKRECCSIPCKAKIQSIRMTGRFISQSTRAKLSATWKNLSPEVLYRRTHGAVGCTRSLETRMKIANSLFGKPSKRRGSLSNLWRGGLSSKNTLARKSIEIKE